MSEPYCSEPEQIDRNAGLSDKEAWLDTEKGTKLSGLPHTNRPLSFQRFIDMAALTEDRNQCRCRR